MNAPYNWIIRITPSVVARSRGIVVKDRRAMKPRSLVMIGAMIGLFLANPLSVIAQGEGLQAWLQPPVLMSIVGILLSVGSAWQMVSDDRRRLSNLEATTVQKETFQEVLKRIDGSLAQLLAHMDNR